jgi:hypothetical protein
LALLKALDDGPCHLGRELLEQFLGDATHGTGHGKSIVEGELFYSCISVSVSGHRRSRQAAFSPLIIRAVVAVSSNRALGGSKSGCVPRIATLNRGVVRRRATLKASDDVHGEVAKAGPGRWGHC